MAKELLQKPLVAAVETVLGHFTPQITGRLDALQAQLDRIQGQLTDLRREMNEKFEAVDTRFEKARDLSNELGIRINTVGTRLDAFTDMLKFVSGKRDDLLERVVRLEMNKGPAKVGPRKKRVG